MRDLVIIGGGPAGLAAALSAYEEGVRDILILERDTSLGGILTLDPRQVDMCDGKFELLLVRAPRDLSEVKDCLQALSRQQYDCGMITFRSTSHVRVWTDPTMPWTLDGEMAEGGRELEIYNLHRAIRLLK